MSSAYRNFSTRFTRQSEPIPGSNQIPNNAGGFVWALNPMRQLERFLILGSEGGTYYVSEQKLTKENALNAIKVIETDGRGAVDLIVGVSESGRAPKNDPAIFALALASADKDPKTRAYALAQLPRVCRIPTHLFHFLAYVKQFRGFGRGLKRAVGDWYQSQDVNRLAYEVVKYQSRDGWANADALRLSHPKTSDEARQALYRWIVDGLEGNEKYKNVGKLPSIVQNFEHAKHTPDLHTLLGLIRYGNLSREMLPTEALNRPEVWEALLEKMPLTAMIRNLGNMSKVGLLTPLSNASRTVISKLSDGEALKKSRVHPVAIMLALKTYSTGHGMLGSGQWNPVTAVIDALDSAFYTAFQNVVPTGKRILVGVDTSGSMRCSVAGTPLKASEGAAIMAMAIVRSEPNYEVVCFNTSVAARGTISKNMSLRQVEAEVNRHPGGTDCAAPIQWAINHKIDADAIIILTDNETWAGKYGHPSQVMTQYRANRVRGAKIINVGMVATNATINDPSDPNELGVAGFDTSVPQVIAGFIGE